MGWVTVSDEYTVCLRGEGSRAQLVCRNPKGRELARVPSSLGRDPAVIALRDLRGRLARHEEDVHAQVRTWVLRSLSVPAVLLTAVWSDPVWRKALTGIVVVPDPDGPDTGEPGAVGDTHPERGVELVALDGTRSWSTASVLSLPHPVRLGADLSSWRALADRHGTADGSPQLDRPVWRRPDDFAPGTSSVGLKHSFGYDAGAAFEKRANQFGGRIRGETAHFQVYGADHGAGPVPVTVGLRWQGLESCVAVNDLAWHPRSGPVDDVAWSEGVNILMELYERSPDAGDDRGGTEQQQVPAVEYRTGDPAPPRPLPVRDERACLVHAGGVALSPARDGEDALIALGLSHPALDGHVVTLVPDHSAAGRRVLWEALGLVHHSETGVGATRHRPPEFLAAVLERHPAQLEHALALLPVLRAQGEVAPAKPGRARKALDEAADTLLHTAPELRHLFLDECAQVLAEVGNASYATGFHDQARAAERELDRVDEDAVIEAYARFPAPGSLPHSLKTHARALAARLDPAEAYRRHRELVIVWCEAEHRASKDLATGLATLAGAAGIVPGDQGSGGQGTGDREADARAVRAMLTNGSLALAPARTWSTFLPLLHSMVAEDPRLGGLLATQIPAPSGQTAKAKAAAARLWARVLRESGVGEPFGTASGVSAAAVKHWADAFLRTYAWMALPAEEVREPLRQAGAVLREAGLAADCSPLVSPFSRHEPQPLGTLDFVVSCGMPLEGYRGKDPEGAERLRAINPKSWLLETPAPHDLTALAADPLWRGRLRAAVDGYTRFESTSGFGRSTDSPIPEDGGHHARRVREQMAEYTRGLVHTPGFADVVDDILADHHAWISGPNAPGLPVLYAAVRAAERFLWREPTPQVIERVEPILAGVRAAESLAATLSGGVTDELHFPVLEGLDPRHSYALEECGPDLYLAYREGTFDSSMRPVGPEGLEPVLTTRLRSSVERRWCSVCLTAQVEGQPLERCTHEDGNGPGETAEERVRFPGGAEVTVRRVSRHRQELVDSQGRVLAAHRIGRGGSSGLMAVREYCHRYAAGTSLVLPPGWWQHMRVRDPEGSAALRTVDTELAAKLLKAVTEDLGRGIASATDRAEPRDMELPEKRRCVDELTWIVRFFLPAITDEWLLKGVTALVWTAVECRERAAALRRHPATTGAPVQS
ncbi:hypothetical protein GCM10007079_28090 [Nocardiopsis terrae]|uniref:DUF4132 domain-containing protein n=1 Tax=Nocardiopsis terrae TaxID=372655 RepID=A0ABR9HF88_9ACTN|nr:DUF4132 domain-containing protein [Nocardiopsis terrae]MBE1457586.1 hypothetical protein [Nocardiopsis terrae]GHC85329.1 hypothetical protein GCM10007079_28090 [Nocardiopsis terrae]